MATNLIDERRSGSFLLELLYFAGWALDVRVGERATIRAKRAGAELEATGGSLAEAAGIAFARAMRSGRRSDQDETG